MHAPYHKFTIFYGQRADGRTSGTTSRHGSVKGSRNRKGDVLVVRVTSGRRQSIILREPRRSLLLVNLSFACRRVDYSRFKRKRGRGVDCQGRLRRSCWQMPHEGRCTPNAVKGIIYFRLFFTAWGPHVLTCLVLSSFMCGSTQRIPAVVCCRRCCVCSLFSCPRCSIPHALHGALV